MYVYGFQTRHLMSPVCHPMSTYVTLCRHPSSRRTTMWVLGLKWCYSWPCGHWICLRTKLYTHENWPDHLCQVWYMIMQLRAFICITCIAMQNNLLNDNYDETGYVLSCRPEFVWIIHYCGCRCHGAIWRRAIDNHSDAYRHVESHSHDKWKYIMDNCNGSPDGWT